MSDFQGRIRLTLQGLDRFQQLDDYLASAGQRAEGLRQALAGINAELQGNITRRGRALQNLAGARQERLSAAQSVINVEQRRGASGRFLPGPNVNARRLARARLEAARIDTKNAQLELGLALDEQRDLVRRGITAKRGRRIAGTLEQAKNIIRKRVSKRQGVLNLAMQNASIAGQGIRLGSLDAQFQRRLQAFRRGGGGTNTPETIEKVFEITQAYAVQKKLISATGDLNVKVTRAQARELSNLSASLGRYNEKQLEANRLARSRVERLSGARRMGDRLRPFEIASGTARDPASGELLFPNVTRPPFPRREVSRARQLVNRAASAAESGDQELFRLASFQAKKIIGKLEAGVKAGLKDAPKSPLRGAAGLPGSPLFEAQQLQKAIRAGGPKESITGRKDLPGSPAYYEEQQRQLARAVRAGGPAEKIAGRKDLPGSPAYYEEQQRQLARAVRAGGPKESITGRKDLPGSPAFLEEQQRQLQKAIRAGGPSLPIAGAATIAGSPKQLAVAERASTAAAKQESIIALREDRLAKLAQQGADVSQLQLRLDKAKTRVGDESVKAQERFKRSILKLDTDIRRLSDSIVKAPKGAAGGAGRGPQGFFQGNLRKAISEGMIGGAFPLLFGQGAGAAVGGLAGGFGGGLIGGSFGFGLSLIGTALGSAVDQTTQGIKDLADSLKSPTEAMAALEASGFRVSDSLKFQVEQLQSVGRAYDAQTLVLQEVEKRLGAGSVQELNALNVEQKRLGEEWSKLTGALQRNLLPILADTTTAFADLANYLSSLPGFSPPTQEEIAKNAKIDQLKKNQGIFGQLFDIETYINPFEGLRRKRRLQIAKSAESGLPNIPQTPQEAFASETTRINRAFELEDLRRDIQRGELSLIRRKEDVEVSIADQRRAESNYEKEIIDYRWTVEQRVFQLRSDAIRAQSDVLQAESDLRAAQIARRYDQSIFEARPGFEQEYLQAAQNLLQTQEQTETKIARGKIETELRIENLKRDQVNRERQLEREKEQLEQRRDQLLRGRVQIERGIADYHIQAADYQRETARRIFMAWRQMSQEMQAAAQGSSGSSMGSAAAAQIANQSFNANARAWARVTRFAEGTAGPAGYNTMFTGRQFSGFADHPRRLQSGGGHTSDAAGAYQFLSTTWDGVRRALGLTDFSPQNQDRGFAYLAAKRGVDVFTAPFTPENVAKLAPEWASFPTLSGGSYYGQPSKPFSQLQRVFNESLVSASVGGSGGRGGFNGTMQTPPASVQELAGATMAVPALPDLAAPARPVFASLPGVPDTAPMQRGMAESTEKITQSQRRLLELSEELADVDRQRATNALMRVAQGPDRVRDAEDRLRLERYMANAVGARTEREQEMLELIAGQRAETELLEISVARLKAQNVELNQLYVDSNGKQGLSNEQLAASNDLLDRQLIKQAEANKLDQESLELRQKRNARLRVDSTLRNLDEELAAEKAQAAALERGELEASNVELLKASTLYRDAEEAQQRKLVALTAETEELRKQNEFRKQVNQLERETRFTGAGLRAGLIGEPARRFEQARIEDRSIEQATDLANLAKAAEDQQLIWANLEKNIVDVSDAISGALTNGLLDIVSGARKIEDVGRDMLNGIARTFADSAQQQLSTLLQRQIAQFAGPRLAEMIGGGTQQMASATAGAAGVQALGSASFVASGQVAAFGAALQTVMAQMAFSGAASGITSGITSGLGSAFSAGAPNILGSFFGGSSGISSAFSIPFGGFLASGGTTKRGEGYVVGEKEPEFFFPGASGRVVPMSDMQKAAALAEDSASNEPIDIRYTVTEQAGERYVTEKQFREGMAANTKRTQAMTYAGMRNSREVREYTGMG